MENIKKKIVIFILLSFFANIMKTSKVLNMVRQTAAPFCNYQ